jgi:carboxylesterase type B
LITVPVIRLAEGQAAAGGSVRTYQVSWATSALEDRLGACHALEPSFVSTPCRWHRPWLASRPGTTPDGDACRVGTVRDLGDPNGGNLPSWPEYSADDRAVMNFDLQPSVLDGPRAGERQLWEGVW